VKIAALCVALAAGIARAGDSAGTFAPEYTLPAAGTYELPPIPDRRRSRAPRRGRRETTLFDVVRGRIAIVAFVYTTCAESTGCPLSTAVLHRIDRSLADDPTFATASR
jgi:cytochrome c peroxidase